MKENIFNLKLLEELESDPDIAQLDSRLSSHNFMEVFSISTNELAHSSFIAWLLNPLEEHGLGDCFLKRFLKEIINKIKEKKRTDIEIPDINKLEYKKVIIKTEELFRQNPVDITIRFRDEKFLCLIENKIKHKETNRQTDTYARLSKKKYINYRYYWYIFLTDSGKQAKSEEFISFNYHDIKDLLEKTIKTIDKIPKNHNIIFLLEQIIVNIENNILNPINYPKTCQAIYNRHKKTFNEIKTANIKKLPYKKAINKILSYYTDYISPLKKKIELDLNDDWDYNLEPKKRCKIYKKQWLKISKNYKETEIPLWYFDISYWINNGLQNIGVEFNSSLPEFTDILDKSFKENKPNGYKYRKEKIKFKITFREGSFETDEDLNNIASTAIQLINSIIEQIDESVMSFKDNY
ncbi:hypothetical protein LCGC14_1471580 [marine sediment metagenome]|uniref:Uncharacterized protein n=1 Tax=marine sediment metagenome TaxID=412755 RepID=A0A0F9JCV8_9ZZZZ